MEEKPREEESKISASSSPEFEFWMVRNPSLPTTKLLSADELFVDGVLQPLHLIPLQPNNPKPKLDPSPAAISATPVSASKRWADVFRLASGDTEKEKEKEKGEKKKRKKRSEKKGATAVKAAEQQIKINIWPFFSRSRSAGNNRPKSLSVDVAGGRKVSSAPCSRSNSGGVGRRSAVSSGGIHVGRASPVWQGPQGKKRGNAVSGGGAGVLNLNVNSCYVGHKQQMRCGGESTDGKAGGGRSTDGSHHFNIKGLFSWKVY